MLSDRNTRASLLGPAGHGHPALRQHSLWFLEHPEMYSQDLVSFQLHFVFEFFCISHSNGFVFWKFYYFSMRERQFGCIMCGTATFQYSSKYIAVCYKQAWAWNNKVPSTERWRHCTFPPPPHLNTTIWNYR
jgi:hypothetical protein